MEEKYIQNFAAITKLACKLAAVDGQLSDDERALVVKFLLKFEEMDEEAVGQIISYGNSMNDMTAISLLKDFDPDSKQMAANLFAAIVCRDDNLTDEERKLYYSISNLASLPEPETDTDYEEEEEEETPAEAADEDEEDDDEIIPAFLVVQPDGVSFAEQYEEEDWNDLKPFLSSLIGADRLEIVRFTRPLNALSQELDLNMCHLVFIMGRDNNDDASLEDNVPASILYGAGYPLYGHAVFAIETDGDYVVEGFRSRSLFYDAVDAINRTVGGLLRFKE